MTVTLTNSTSYKHYRRRSRPGLYVVVNLVIVDLF